MLSTYEAAILFAKSNYTRVPDGNLLHKLRMFQEETKYEFDIYALEEFYELCDIDINSWEMKDHKRVHLNALCMDFGIFIKEIRNDIQEEMKFISHRKGDFYVRLCAEFYSSENKENGNGT